MYILFIDIAMAGCEIYPKGPSGGAKGTLQNSNDLCAVYIRRCDLRMIL